MDKAQALKTLGYQVEELDPRVLDNVKRMDFVNKEGELKPNLPCDAYHLARWKARGFTVAPPREPEELKCDICGAGPFKAKIGKLGHMRSHT